jgi:predicted metalloprotease
MTDDGTAPKPGHYLPGGAGDGTGDPGPQPVRPPERPPVDTGAGHLQQRSYGWTSQSAARHAAPSRPPYERRRLSKPAIAGLCIAALVVGAGGVAGVAQLLKPWDGLVSKPLVAPTVPPTATPSAGSSPEVTVTVTATPEPDAMVVKRNDFYTTGHLKPSKCHEPRYRPTSKQQVTAYFQALLPCLNASWAPTVRKSGHEFRSPRLVMFKGTANAPCVGTSQDAFYCGTNETIYLPWPVEIEEYRDADRTWARIDMAATIAHEYGHHVQQLTGILDASQQREDGAPTREGSLLESRRLELQAECLSAVYLGADADWFPMHGRLYDKWLWRAKHHGDEYNEEKVRDHGSRKNVAAWSVRGFTTPDPKSCNTFTAPASKVS